MADATFDDLFGSEILLHYDASDVASLFTDTGGTAAASDGNEVKCWKPQSDASLAVNLTNSAGPIYRANYASSGYAALEFDGVNDALLNASTGLTTSQKVFILAVYDTIGSSGTVWGRGNTGSWLRAFFSSGAELLQTSSGTGANISTGLSADKRAMAYVAGTGQTQMDALGLSAGVQASGLPPSLTGAFTIGALNTGSLSQFGNMAFHEIMVIGSGCEWGQVIRGAKLMRTKWGISDPNSTPQSAAGGVSRLINGGLVRGQVL
jgi:hypothetical protein